MSMDIVSSAECYWCWFLRRVRLVDYILSRCIRVVVSVVVAFVVSFAKWALLRKLLGVCCCGICCFLCNMGTPSQASRSPSDALIWLQNGLHELLQIEITGQTRSVRSQLEVHAEMMAAGASVELVDDDVEIIEESEKEPNLEPGDASASAIRDGFIAGTNTPKPKMPTFRSSSRRLPSPGDEKCWGLCFGPCW